jgi:hypothetical protein
VRFNSSVAELKLSAIASRAIRRQNCMRCSPLTSSQASLLHEYPIVTVTLWPHAGWYLHQLADGRLSCRLRTCLANAAINLNQRKLFRLLAGHPPVMSTPRHGVSS